MCCFQLATNSQQSCILHVINLNGIFCVKNWGRLIIYQTWCCLKSVKALCWIKSFLQAFYTSFRWLLVVCSEMFLRSILQSWLYRPMPVCHNFCGVCRGRVTWAGLYIAAIGMALLPLGSPRNGQTAINPFNPYPTAFPYGNGMVLHFYQQQESSTTKTVHKVINKRLKTYV